MYGYMDCFGWVLVDHGTWALGDRNMGFLCVVHKPYICMLTGVREGHWRVLPPNPQVRLPLLLVY